MIKNGKPCFISMSQTETNKSKSMYANIEEIVKNQKTILDANKKRINIYE